MKKILYISGLQIFPVESGGQMRSATLCGLLSRPHSPISGVRHVTLYSLTGRKEDYLHRRRTFVQNIQANLNEQVNLSPLWGILQFICYKLKLPPMGTYYLSCFSLFIPNGLKKIFHNSDTFILDTPYLYPLVRTLLKKGRWRNSDKDCIKDNKTDRPMVYLNTHNVEHHLWNKDNLLSRIISSWIKSVEVRALQSCDQVFICSQNDLDFWSKSHSKHIPKFHLIPNGLNQDSLSVQPQQVTMLRKKWHLRDNDRIVLFSGSFYPPNQQAFEFLLHFCKRHSALLRKWKIKFLVVGSVSPTAWEDEHMIVTSKVPQIYPYFLLSHCAINPITEGSGSNVKMSEYIFFKLPILTSKFGARGFELKHGEDCCFFNEHNLADILEEFFNLTATQKEEMALRALNKNIQLIDMSIGLKQHQHLFT